mmetsp:Transcript_38/g.55  ORF Transcript_38/g.55 Transcript_38/m.55 type:complete len:93 (+) Transcript_38:236-514(+)
MDAPGLKVTDIKISRHNSTTLIRGTRRPPAMLEVENCKAEKQERKYGDFAVSVEVPMKYKARWTSCTLANGVLTITYLPDTDEQGISPALIT